MLKGNGVLNYCCCFLLRTKPIIIEVDLLTCRTVKCCHATLLKLSGYQQSESSEISTQVHSTRKLQEVTKHRIHHRLQTRNQGYTTMTVMLRTSPDSARFYRLDLHTTNLQIGSTHNEPSGWIYSELIYKHQIERHLKILIRLS